MFSTARPIYQFTTLSLAHFRMKKYFFVPLLLLLLSACATSATQTPNRQATIDAAVQATLAAVPSPAPATSTPMPMATSAPATDSTPIPQPEPAARRVILPPLVNDFDPAPRPASTLGDPDAPVVMYEWSDYT